MWVEGFRKRMWMFVLMYKMCVCVCVWPSPYRGLQSVCYVYERVHFTLFLASIHLNVHGEGESEGRRERERERKPATEGLKRKCGSFGSCLWSLTVQTCLVCFTLVWKCVEHELAKALFLIWSTWAQQCLFPAEVDLRAGHIDSLGMIVLCYVSTVKIRGISVCVCVYLLHSKSIWSVLYYVCV